MGDSEVQCARFGVGFVLFSFMCVFVGKTHIHKIKWQFFFKSSSNINTPLLLLNANTRPFSCANKMFGDGPLHCFH